MNRKPSPSLVVSTVALVFACTGVAAAALPADLEVTALQTQSIPSLAAGSATTRDYNLSAAESLLNTEPVVAINDTGGRLTWSVARISNLDGTDTLRITYRNVSGTTSPAGSASVQVLLRGSD